MGKSPGKWIKTVLTGRRSSKSNSSKESKGKTPDSVFESPVISEQVPDTAVTNTNREPEVFALPANETSVLHVNRDSGGTNANTSNEGNEPKNEKEELAATKAQAAFRGYLARKAFHALRGILRLQALIRGHLVRRQAIATLYCMHGIVRLQAIVRGQKVRLSNETSGNFHKALSVEVKHVGSPNADIFSMRRRFRAHTFIHKLLSATPAGKLLRIPYSKEDPNSIWIWLERWTASRFWKPVPSSKRLIELKSKLRYRVHVAEAESGRPKHSVRRNFSKSNDAASTATNSETDRNKHNPKKFNSLPEDPVEVNPQSELEKVKRNLRKISNSWAQASNQADPEIEKSTNSTRKFPSSCNGIPNKAALESYAEATETLANGFEETTADTNLKSNQNICVPPDFDAKPIEAHVVADSSKCENPGDNPSETLSAVNSPLCDDLITELCPLQGIVLDDNRPDLHEAAPTEVELINGNQKAKRRSSFSSKSEYPENSSLETPKLPSYMAATESAKAKLRGQGSPSLSLDGSEKNGFIRRHSLPSSHNGKSTSQSPRMQRPVQSGNKGGASNKSGRDGNDKPIRAEWKRW